MTKGHNKGKPNDPDPKNKVKGQERHLSDQKKNKAPDRGRNPNPDPSKGSKGKNSID